MQRRRRQVSLAIALAAAITFAACGSDDDEPSATTAAPVGLANPASEFCVEQGGEVEIVDGDDGQTGVCHLPDGTSVDEWDYFREHHPDATTPD